MIAIVTLSPSHQGLRFMLRRAAPIQLEVTVRAIFSGLQLAIPCSGLLRSTCHEGGNSSVRSRPVYQSFRQHNCRAAFWWPAQVHSRALPSCRDAPARNYLRRSA
jgi:hypothetical protein